MIFVSIFMCFGRLLPNITRKFIQNGYWQVEIQEKDKTKTVFQVATLGFYESTGCVLACAMQQQHSSA